MIPSFPHTKLLQIVVYFFIICMKHMNSIFSNTNSCCIIYIIIYISSNMTAFINDEYRLIQASCKMFCNCSA